MPSPLFPGFGAPSGMNPFQIMQLVNQLQQNPSSIGQFLFDNHRITQEQLNQINRLGGSPQQIVQYLTQNGIMQQGPLNTFQNQASQFFRR